MSWGWIDKTRGLNRPRVSQSLFELHRHRGVSHPCPPQSSGLHPVLSLVQEVDKAHTRAIPAEHMGYL